MKIFDTLQKKKEIEAGGKTKANMDVAKIVKKSARKEKGAKQR